MVFVNRKQAGVISPPQSKLQELNTTPFVPPKPSVADEIKQTEMKITKWDNMFILGAIVTIFALTLLGK